MTHTRSGGRREDQLREVHLERNYTRHAEGSVLVAFGDTRVICNASVERGVPPFLRGSGRGWATAEYGMLPRSTGSRMDREAARGKQGGRTVEIQRLIGRSLRSVIDFDLIGEVTIKLDCDVIQADGGTRTASITGGCVALVDAVRSIVDVDSRAIKDLVAAVSVGVVGGRVLLDLEYVEDSGADTDMNVVMSEGGDFIEVQGTAEKSPFSRPQLDEMLDLATGGVSRLLALQREALSGD